MENLVVSLKLESILAYERTGAWRADGAASIEAWVAYALGVKARTASDYVRVARAFRRLPLIHLAFRDGRFSFDQVQALVRVATPGNEAELIDASACRSAEEIERMARAMRPVSRDDAEGANADRWVRWWWSSDRLSLDVSARLPAVEGAMVVTALERIAHRDHVSPRATHEQRCADALAQLSCCDLEDADEGRALVRAARRRRVTEARRGRYGGHRVRATGGVGDGPPPGVRRPDAADRRG